MYSLRYDSLRKRLVLPFAILALLISALQGGITYWVVASIEEQAIRRALQTEMESFRNRHGRNPGALPPSTSLLRGVRLPSSQFPALSEATDGTDSFRRLTLDGREHTVLVGEVEGTPYALLYDHTQSESGLDDLAWVLAFGALFMAGVGALVGHRLAGEVVRPIRRLLGEIAEKSAEVGPSAPPASFGAKSYPDNEIGQMVHALERFASRLHGYAQRESHFAADVSHELRTPLAVIRGGAEVMTELPNVPEPLRERLNTIHRQAVRASEILEAMLLLSRENVQSSDPACAIAEVIAETMSDCAGKLDDRRVNVEPGYPGTPHRAGRASARLRGGEQPVAQRLHPYPGRGDHGPAVERPHRNHGHRHRDSRGPLSRHPQPLRQGRGQPGNGTWPFHRHAHHGTARLAAGHRESCRRGHPGDPLLRGIGARYRDGATASTAVTAAQRLRRPRKASSE